MSTILDEIVAFKRGELAQATQRRPLAELERALPAAGEPRGFARSLAQRAAEGPAIIAEIKRGSPSLGCIRPDLAAPDQAAAYQSGGAAALSVLTDRHFFFAREEDFDDVRRRVTLPMLRKDFIIDPWQLLESRVMGADCVLVIMSILSDKEAAELAEKAHALGMDVLAETHSREEIRRVLDHVPYDLIGINNRNLKTFETHPEFTLDLAGDVPDLDCLVAESGLHHPETLARYWRSGIKRFLVGEAFVRTPDPQATVRQFANAHLAP